MADFETAFLKTMEWEDSKPSGAVTPEPKGARVRFGINSAAHPEMPADFWTGDPADQIKVAEGTYLKEYWTPLSCGAIENQDVAWKVFDIGVNAGLHRAGMLLQQVLNELYPANMVPITGHIGSLTLAAVNVADPVKVLEGLRAMLHQYYVDLCDNDPDGHGKWRDGYLRRAAA